MGLLQYFSSTSFMLITLLVATTVTTITCYYHPVDNISIDCGSSRKSTASDGREWAGDKGSRHGSSVRLSQPSQSFLTELIPYSTARVSVSQFSYDFRVTPGQKFVRLHFYPASYPGFDKSRDFFTVKSGSYTLLSNFSASIQANSMGLNFFSKEFCLNVEENQILSITFTPSPTMYAFVNGIEVISMPTDLYHTPESNPGVPIIARKHLLFDIDNSIALEVVHRLNIGGSSILPVEDTGMFRAWLGASAYSTPSGILPIATTIPIKYNNFPAYTAPLRVYQSAWLMDPDKLAYINFNLTWKLPVDVGFRYLVRMHFCELDYGIKESSQREFDIFLNDRLAETNADIIKWSGANGVPVYKDYMVILEGDPSKGKSDLTIALQPHYSESETNYPTGVILNGLEIVKLSNPDNNLAGHTPQTSVNTPNSIKTKLQRTLWSRDGIVGILIILLILLNAGVHKLRNWVEKSEREISPSLLPSNQFGRRFSLSEVQSATNNFDDALVIGDGGFGKVYKGQIDKGSRTVAIKRLKALSKQGADEFWTEIKTLSKLMHINLVTLIGYCDENKEMILVYGYMINGSLADHLHKITRTLSSRQNETPEIREVESYPLSWERRLQICIGAARGLDYLHSGAEHRVIHRDVKTSNILLDENWVAKISDFGLSKMGGNSHNNGNQSSTSIVTDVKGTFGYLDLEYFLTHRLTRKSDVYAFGVVLFEVLCGRPAVDRRFEGEERSLALWARRCINEGRIEDMIDPFLKGKILPHSLKIFVGIAEKCLHSRPNERPRMSDVLQKLEFALSSKDHFGWLLTEVDEEKDLEEVATDTDEAVSGDSGRTDAITKWEERDVGKTSDIDDESENKEIAGDGNSNTNLLSKTSPPIGSSNLIHGNMPEISTQKSNKRTVMKLVQSALRRKTKDDSPKNQASWWSKKTSKMTEVKPLPEVPESSLLPESPRIFSLDEIRAATHNFGRPNNIDYGEWYQGSLDDIELQVAIQRCRKQNKEYSLSEVEKLYQLHNVHIVSFIGYCKMEEEIFLVYEFMVKGILCKHLYGSRISPLPWKKRLDICISIASGLHYLHRENIIHGNLKSSKILLDNNWSAKISGLKVFKDDEDDANGITHTVVTAVVRNTLGYMDPEYLMSGHLTAKSDVYSFGVVLLEVLCARKAMDLLLPQKERVLVQWFKQSITKRNTERVIDPNLMGNVERKCLRKFVETALSCLHDLGKKRPTMDIVLGSLQQAQQLQETAGDHLTFGTKTGDPQEKLHEAAAAAYNKVLFRTGKKLEI
ncbi:putative receptor-like protein kinase At5g39000 [Impatiens glandulifera]|uniref:putative receptor-like protein kinase At5g39000 n=1 Tax=Impatiens glandulifera TaxID=253017 RepID=UPI001FB1412E|nr:putative receptor-like protein kinase At5g39000 [Impatiens glandulifera]